MDQSTFQAEILIIFFNTEKNSSFPPTPPPRGKNLKTGIVFDYLGMHLSN